MFNFFGVILFLIFMFPSNNADGIHDYLKKYFSDYESVEYEIVSAPKDIKDINRIVISEDVKPKISNGFFYLPVILPEKNTQSIITLKVKIYTKVAVAAGNIEKRSSISSSDIKIEIKDVAQLSTSAVIDVKNLEGTRAKINIKQGSILQPYMLEKIPDVLINDKVDAVVSKGNVEVIIEAKAKEEGSIGDVIRIISQGNKYFQAKVVNSSKVRILE